MWEYKWYMEFHYLISIRCLHYLSKNQECRVKFEYFFPLIFLLSYSIGLTFRVEVSLVILSLLWFENCFIYLRPKIGFILFTCAKARVLYCGIFIAGEFFSQCQCCGTSLHFLYYIWIMNGCTSMYHCWLLWRTITGKNTFFDVIWGNLNFHNNSCTLELVFSSVKYMLLLLYLFSWFLVSMGEFIVIALIVYSCAIY